MSTQSGNLVIHEQSNCLRIRKSQKAQPKKILGIYEKFATIDYLEAINLIEYSRTLKSPKNIELESLLASFGRETMFTLLPDKDQQNNPMIFRSITDALKKENIEMLGGIEDEYG